MKSDARSVVLIFSVLLASAISDCEGVIGPFPTGARLRLKRDVHNSKVS